MKVSARLAQAQVRAVAGTHMLPSRRSDSLRYPVPLPSQATSAVRGLQRTTSSRPKAHAATRRSTCSSTNEPIQKTTPFEGSGRATPVRRSRPPAGSPTCYSRYDLARARVLLATHYEKPFDPQEHPRDANGQFVRTGQDSTAPLRPLVPTGTKLRRLDSEETGSGMIWSIDGRPWELSEQDANDWRAITSRGSWADGLNSVFPIFWTSVPEFEAEIRRKARSYRDRMLRLEGSAATVDPIELEKRRSARAQAALQADFAELATTVDNATFLAGLAKAPLKAGVGAITKAAESRASAALAADAAAEAAIKTRSAFAVTNAERSGLAAANELVPPRPQSSVAQALESSADRSATIERSLLDDAASVQDAQARAAAAEARLELHSAASTNDLRQPPRAAESTHALEEAGASQSRPSAVGAETTSEKAAVETAVANAERNEWGAANEHSLLEDAASVHDAQARATAAKARLELHGPAITNSQRQLQSTTAEGTHVLEEVGASQSRPSAVGAENAGQRAFADTAAANAESHGWGAGSEHSLLDDAGSVPDAQARANAAEARLELHGPATTNNQRHLQPSDVESTGALNDVGVSHAQPGFAGAENATTQPLQHSHGTSLDGLVKEAIEDRARSIANSRRPIKRQRRRSVSQRPASPTSDSHRPPSPNTASGKRADNPDAFVLKRSRNGKGPLRWMSKYPRKNRKNVTRLGVHRNKSRDWRAIRDTWDSTGQGDILSAENRKKIADGLAPHVDDNWIRWFPGDAHLKHEEIQIHHLKGSVLNVPLPQSRHLDAHMPGGYKLNDGGPGRSG